MAKPQGDRVRPKEYKAVLCNVYLFFSGSEDSAYIHVCHLHLCMAVGCGCCFDHVNFSHAELRDHFKSCTAEGFDSGLTAGLE